METDRAEKNRTAGTMNMGEELKLQMNEFLPLRDVVFQTLRQAILNGKLQPGERLLEIHLARQLGVSRTPVREAIHKLEQENLVVTIPRRGAVVAQITRSDLEDVLEVRSALEELALRKACRNMTDAQLSLLWKAAEEFEECIRREDLIASAQADVRFHQIISEATGNRRLLQMLNNMRGQMYRYRLENLKDKNSYPKLLRQHRLICEALEERSEEKAIDAIRMHIEDQKETILGNLKNL